MAISVPAAAPTPTRRGILYSAIGGLVKEQFGTTTAPIYNKLFYNSRGQLAEVRASTSYTGPTDYDANRGAIVNSYSDQCTGICSGSSMSDNNGNLKRQDIYIPNEQTRAQQYVYDSLNRLQSARELIGSTEQWKQQFSYDRFGNRTINTDVTYGNGINNRSFDKQTATNRLYAPGDLALPDTSRQIRYDTAGNQIKDAYTGAGDRTYDGENKITSAWGGNGQAQLYSYDASGQRIKRTVNGVETWQVYGLGGELVAEYPANGAVGSPQKEYGYRNGQLLVTADVTPGMNGYTNQRTITIDHTKVPNTDQSNFPVLISGTFSYLATVANGGSVQNANGYDVIFTSDAGCATKLDHQVDTYNATTGAVNYWVRVPLLSHTNDTTIYMCYGNSSITTDQSNKTGVWDSNFKAVYHLNDQAATTTVADSSANSSNGVNAANTSSKSVSGKVGQALNYNGSSDSTATGVSQTSSFTWECWFKLTDWTTQAGSSNYSTLISGVYGNGGALLMLWKDSAYLVQFAVDNAGGVTSGTNSIAPGSWHHVAYTRTGNSGTYALYLDGEWKGQVASGTNSANTTITLGMRTDATAQAFNGLLDETRISNTARSADWIKTEYNNQSSPGTFYSISAGTTGSTTSVSWLVTDHLGTPRMILDQTGSLSGIKRHDYLPFGEELFGGTDASPGPGSRKPSLGYGCNPSDPNCTPDRVRQQFTSKERDNETGLDYFEARYFSPIQARFTSPDSYNVVFEREITAQRNPRKAEQRFIKYLSQPQNWNRLTYVNNNPLNATDPTGEVIYLTGSAEEQEKALERIKNMLGADRFKYVTVSKFCDAKAGNVTVLSYDSKASHLGIERIGQTERAISFSVHMADILESKNAVEFRIAREFNDRDGHHTTAEFGGAATLGANESLTGNVQTWVSPVASDIAENRMNTWYMAERWTGSDHIDYFDDIVDAHEFGHAHEGLFGGEPNSDLGKKKAVDHENAIRERRGLKSRRLID